MPNIGLPELIVILMILLLVFGASRLPQIGESLGRSMRSLKRGLASDDQIEVTKGTSGPAAAKKSSAADSEISDAEIVDKKS